MVEDSPGADQATTNPQTKEAPKKRMCTAPTKVNANDWKPTTINNDGIPLSKPDTFLVIEEENPIFTTTTQQLAVVEESSQPKPETRVIGVPGRSSKGGHLSILSYFL